ncbi:hypothetical protein B0H11DRAFT_2422641 [Mycena galericulata]|nr:hypothetical protein B0H11DRAFT_2422641 [Mycena galericulata]
MATERHETDPYGYESRHAWEQFWIAHQSFLLSQGYLLRPRFHPDWVPAWKKPGASGHALRYEDSRPAWRSNVLDATRVADGSKVVLKRVRTWTSEISLASYFNSDVLREDPHNRTFRLLDIIYLPNDNDFALIVMPFLRLFDSPKFRDFEEVTEAMRQFLQVRLYAMAAFLAFIPFIGPRVHASLQRGTQVIPGRPPISSVQYVEIQPRDACSLNLMMDPTNVIPRGFHFSAPWTEDGVEYGVYWRPRSSVSPVDYYFIDFGLSDYWPDGPENTWTVGVFGQDRTVPELSATIPYNPFKVDIYQLGNVFAKLITKYPAMAEHFESLASSMTRLNPDDRPTASEALADFEAICSSMSPAEMTERLYLRPRSPDGSSISGEGDSDYMLDSESEFGSSSEDAEQCNENGEPAQDIESLET